MSIFSLKASGIIIQTINQHFILAFFDTECDREEYAIVNFENVTEKYQGVELFEISKASRDPMYFYYRKVTFDASPLKNKVWLPTGGSYGWIANEVKP